MLERLHDHREWANQQIIEWYLALPHAEEYCLKMISHILLSEEHWLARMRGVPGGEVWTILPPDELNARWSANNAAWREILRSDLSRVVRYTRFGGESCESVVSDIATHVCTHAVYHRGQIAAQAARAGLK
ncbi:MAG TPA: hypothetical protein DCQ83_01270, partial [Fibrobacteres bacterium]|nr:hypothetical protein [Fibrobacterota bacterium]